MAGPARWYLAVLVMMSLGLLAAHFAVQEHVQKNMRLAVHDWLQESGGDVQHVRYHLLRGALTLEKVHWVGKSDAGMALDVEQVFIQTSSQVMSSNNPTFSLLRLEHPVLSLRRATLLGWLRGNPANALHAVAELQPHAKAVLVHDMSLRLIPDATAPVANAVPLQGISGRIAADGIKLSGKLNTGSLGFDGHVDDEGALSGNIALLGVPLDALAFWLGSTASPGVLASGDVQVNGAWAKRDIAMQGDLQLYDNKTSASLAMQGNWSAAGVSMEMTCGNVPLLGLPVEWPTIAGRTLVAGRLNGVLHLERGWQQAGWNAGINGELLELGLYGEHLSAWKIGRLRLSKAELVSGDGRLTAAEMHIADADIELNAFAGPDDVPAVLTPEIGKLSLQHIHPKLFFADGSELVLPELEGSGSLGRFGTVALSSPKPAEDAGPGPHETWKMKVEGDVFADWQAQLKAGHVPVVRLRPLLPDISLPGEQGVPEYSGHADVSLQLRSAAHGLQAMGGAVLHDVRMVQGGDQLSAVRIDVDITNVGSDGSRKLSRVQLSDWLYQLGLRPLARAAPPARSPVAAQATDSQSPSEGVANQAPLAAQPVPSPALNWELAEFSAENGRISLGQSEALIAEKLLLRAHHLSSGALSPFTLSGEFAGGDLLSQGKLQLQPAFNMTSKTSINNALPFAFNNWMRLSGMPRFVRGRWNAVLNIGSDGPAADRAYTGKLIVGLYQGLMEAGAFPEDPMLQRTGYRAQDLLERLNTARKVSLSIPFQGAWDASLLTDTLGEAGMAVLKKAGSEADISGKHAVPPVSKLTRLRLQGKKGFSHNERVRLRQMVKQLHADKTLIVELTPQLGTAPLDAEMINRVVYSQGLVERFLRRMGIASKRIYPVWPQPVHQRGDAPGLLLQARPS